MHLIGGPSMRRLPNGAANVTRNVYGFTVVFWCPQIHPDIMGLCNLMTGLLSVKAA